ncbi:MAG TPA: hypothetical protein VK477_04105, partial [Acidobacteriota bacterium]|nr:hypothetical protein [Acidobacteriota bacterium]
DTIISVDNRDLKLRPGMTANVSIVVARRDNVLRIPNSTLRLRIPDSIAVKRDEPAAAPKADSVAKADTSAKKDAPPTPAATTTASAGGNSGESGQGGGRRGGGMFGNLTPEQRQKMRQISAELGIDFRNGPPTAEQREQLRKAMAEAGLPVPDAATTARPGEAVVTTRKVYKLVGLAPNQSLEELTIKAGITDGSATEVIDGLKEGDVVVSSVFVPNAAPSTGQQRSTNPFGGGGRRF